MSGAQSAYSDNIDRALHATIALYRGNRVICAGQRISVTHVLTAYHCAVAATLPIDELRELDGGPLGFAAVPVSKVQLRKAEFSTYEQILNRTKAGAAFNVGKFERLDPEHDLALIFFDDPFQAMVEVRSTPMSVGEPVFSIGHPGGYVYTYAGGWVASVCRKDEELQPGCWTQADITIHGGSSGGGLYDGAGRLVGVASAGYLEGQGLFVTPEHVFNFVNNIH